MWRGREERSRVSEGARGGNGRTQPEGSERASVVVVRRKRNRASRAALARAPRSTSDTENPLRPNP